MTDLEDVWVPEACTLPTVEQPLRVREFDDLFATSLLGTDRVAPTVLRWWLNPDAEETVRDLTAREVACCSFFSFHFASTAEALQVDLEVPVAHVAVLDALVARAAAGMTKR